MYGSERYGINGYSQELQVSPEEIKPYIPDLMKYLPPWYRNSNIMVQIENSAAKEIGLARYYQEDILKQCFVDTATWGLTFWENTLNIPIDLNKSYEDRREIIKAKLRGSGTTTVQMIKNTAEAFSGGECNVIPHNEDYSFTVQFIGVKGIPKNMGAFKQMLEDIKPAHLAYDFKYTYTVWNLLNDKKLTWDTAKSHTWNNLKIYE